MNFTILMKNKKDKIKRITADDSGSAMVVVIIAMAFIGILASVLMYTSLLNYQMKVNNLKAKDNFYSAETVLDEIRLGIEGDVSDEMQNTYQEILVKFAGTTEEKQYRMRYSFLSGLQSTYNAAGAANSYSLEMLYDYLSSPGEGVVLEASYNGTAYSITRNASGDYVDKDGNAIDSANPPKGTLVLYADGLSFKNLKVTYTDTAGYVSIITTDLRVCLPDMEFAQSVSLPSLTSFSLVAQEDINVGPDTGVSTNTIRGTFYGANMNIGSVNGAASPAIVNLRLEEDAVDYNSDKRMVIAENLNLGKGSTLYADEYGELWTRNILMNGKSSSGNISEINFEGNDVYVADDLEINGEENVFKVGKLEDSTYKGQYIGFGTGDNADESSSIIVNGIDTELYLDKVTNLTIAGNTYIGLNSTDSKLDGTEGVYNEETMADVVMGQSIAVKSDQVAYLVPAECLAIDKDTGERVKDTLTNPMTIEDYKTYIQNNSDVIEVSDKVKSSTLGDKTLSDYGLITDGANPMFERYFKRINSKITLVYYYVVFDSKDSASLQNAAQYFADYYKANKSTMDAYSKLYTKNIVMRDSVSGFYTLHLAGDVVSMDASSAQLQSSTLNTDKTNVGYSSQLSTDYDKFYNALCRKLIDSPELLKESEKSGAANVYSNLVYSAMISSYFTAVNNDTSITDKTTAKYFGDNDVKAVIVNGDYTYPSDGTGEFNGLIIATGNVTVNKSFKGTILSGGSITLGRDVTVEPDKTSVLRALTYTKIVNGYEYHVTDFLIGGSGYLSGSSKAYTSTNIDIGDLIVYENWQKQ